MNRRMRLALPIVLALGLVGAACGSDTPERSSAAEDVADTAESIAERASTEAAVVAETVDGSGEASAASDELVGTIKIGAALSQTGKFSVEGKDSRQGYDT